MCGDNVTNIGDITHILVIISIISFIIIPLPIAHLPAATALLDIFMIVFFRAGGAEDGSLKFNQTAVGGRYGL